MSDGEANPEIQDAIAANAAGPKSATGDSGSITQHSIAEQIAADRYLATKAAMKLGAKGLRHQQLVPRRSCP